jgi:hypothetical protein
MAEVLWDFGRQSGDPADQDMVDGLVAVRGGQQVFGPVVRDYLTMVTYEDGWDAAGPAATVRGRPRSKRSTKERERWRGRRPHPGCGS